MAVAENAPVGALKLELVDTQGGNVRFSETPFYIKCNLLAGTTLAQDTHQKLYDSVWRLVSGDFNLSNASLINASVTYTVNLVDNPPL